MIITSFIAAMVSFPSGNITKKLLANELGIMPSSVFLINFAPWRVPRLIQVGGKKDPEGIEPLGLLYGNLLRLTSFPQGSEAA